MTYLMQYLLIVIYISTVYSEEVLSRNETVSSIGVSIAPTDIEIELNQMAKVFVHFIQPLSNRTQFTFTYRDASGRYYITSKKLPIKPLESFTIESDSNTTYEASVFANKPGSLKLGITSTSFNVTYFDLIYTSITVYRLKSLVTLQQLVGWTYFLAWTLSFYPQIILNCRRKSVEGLSFDFIVYNVIGFLCYSIFNVGLYFIPLIQEDYFKIYPLGVIPVQLNDLFFSVHALVITLVVAVQCFFYERGSQRVSRLCKSITILMLIFVAFSTLLAALNSITWLSALYLFSYVKLLVTLIKYIPQAILNCRRRSCVGWSLGNVILDFVGGILSISQMFIIAYNCDDWGSVLGSPTKLGLGIVSIAFDVLFFVQHHIYKQPGLQIQRQLPGERGNESEAAPLVSEVTEEEEYCENHTS